ncbi:GDSL esterase/lipase At5g03820 [Physcomitrium patens]|uniref:Uncharacterized protein n=2 Tax=Physcomitrium patens TaxID=3218 RepID=A0A7I4EJ62_PHYPA|nr:GDSL esterase/lipase At5g03820-like [Physcomitrium patens]|eukprot:XP_024382012.1 GDSL esterase/lipase At5g03820-like [Physcomitrella patens]
MPEPIWPGSDKGVLLYVGCFLQSQDSYQLPNTEGRLRLASVTSLACDPWMIKFMQRVVRLQGSSLTRYPEAKVEEMANSVGFLACCIVLLMSNAATGVLGTRNLDLKGSKDQLLDREVVPALVVFGDSTVDAGNNNYITTIVKADFAPYGKNFMGHVPTGRFTDGLLVTDYISLKLGIPLQLPYLSPAAHGESILTGVNFASSASGWFDNTATHFNVVGLTKQFEWFKSWKAEVLSLAGPKRGNFIISNALYAFSTGSNDWVNNYYINPPLMKKYTPQAYTTLLLGFVEQYTMELYSLGGRNIAILNLPPLGCLPAQITLHGHGNQTCVQSLNDVALGFNQQLPGVVDAMNKKTPGARLIILDIYNPIYNAWQDPQKFGFKYARVGCCGTGDLEVSVLCNRAVPACSNADEHIFFDSFHPTGHFYSQLADYMYSYAKPILLAPPNP